jgi:hypothetical protein
VWETATNLITLGSLSNGKVTVTAGSSAGNAVIAAYSGVNQSGTILWSWHIWVTDYDPNNGGKTYSVTNTGSPACTYVFMDRNLGATTAMAGDPGTIGLLYQWGRKDPFTGSSSFNSATEITVYDKNGIGFTFDNKSQTVSSSNNLANSILHPEIFYGGSYGDAIGYDWYTATNSTSLKNYALWGGSSIVTPGEKTIFDPCPAGWRVPAWSGSKSPWSPLTTSNFAWSDSEYGRTYNGSYYPATGFRDASLCTLAGIGTHGDYWSASLNSVYAHNLYFSNDFVSPSTWSHNSVSAAVRCVKE